MLINEAREGVNKKLETWHEILDSNSFRLSRSKTKYLDYKFSVKESLNVQEVTIRDSATQRVEKFRYLRSIIHHKKDSNEDAVHIIKVSKKEKWICCVV